MPNRYVSGVEQLRSAIFYENKEDATAPAQEVVIEDQLDLDQLDLDTFSFGPIHFGSKVVTPQAGLTEYHTEIDLRPERNLVVLVDANLNKETGLVTWRFVSIDPGTGNAPEDLLSGFLPPNALRCSLNPDLLCNLDRPCADQGECFGNGEGEGSVVFTIKPKKGLPTGSQTANTAKVYFDNQPEVVTNTWINTIDNTPPVSRFRPLADVQTRTSFLMEWPDSSDEGSGIRDYTILFSENGGGRSTWLRNTRETSATFTGERGKSYDFYIFARDLTGNVENSSETPGAMTRISLDSGFRRGDADGSAEVDITDAINILGYLFLGTQLPDCQDASDVDDSGEVDVSDPINLLDALFLGSFIIPLPSQRICGPDPTLDPHGCFVYPACP